MKKICQTCAYFDRDGFEERYGLMAKGMDMGFCRRNPPQPDIARMVTTGACLPRRHMVVFSVYPETCADDWCGEWRLSSLRVAAEQPANEQVLRYPASEKCS